VNNCLHSVNSLAMIEQQSSGFLSQILPDMGLLWFVSIVA